MTKRIPLLLALLVCGFLFMGADGCASDPNVEGAKLDLKSKEYDRALENVEIALQKNPDNTEALELKGRILQEKAFTIDDPNEHANLISQMMEAFERAAILDPELDQTIENTLRIAYINEFQRGVQAFNRGRTNELEFNTAVIYFQAASVIMPDSAGPYVNQGFALMNAGRDAEAIVPFERAITHGENAADTYTFLSNLYLVNNRAADAVTLLKTARDLYPQDADMQAQLLNAYQLSGQIDLAMEEYGAAVAEDPNNKIYRYNYGSLLLDANQFDDAIEQLQVAVDLDNQYANAQYNLGAAYVNKAVTINDQINAIDDDLRANRDSYSDAEKNARQDEMDRLADDRRALFQQAIAPLEQARTLFEANGEDAMAICQVLFQRYVQTNQRDRAESIQACAGYDDMN